MDPRDERSDLYSLAATLYALGMGRPPFQSATAAGLIGRIISTPVPATGLMALDAFLAVAMAKDPAARYPTAAQFIAALRPLALEPVTAAAVGVAGPSSAVPPPAVSVHRTNDRSLSLPPHTSTSSSAPAAASQAVTPDPSTGTDAPGSFARRQAVTAIGVGLAIGLLLAVGYLGVGYYNRSIWFVQALDDGTVGVFNGRPSGLLWLEPELQSTLGPSVSELIPEDQDEVANRPTFKSAAEAEAFVESLLLAGEIVKEQAGSLGGFESSTSTVGG